MSALTTDFYATLDTETRIVVQQRTGEIRTLVRRTAQDIIEIGTKLLDVKERLPHGAFGRWLKAEFEWNERTALAFMQVANHFKSANFSDLEIGAAALYLLASPSTPEEAREEALTRAEHGEPISHQVAKQIVAAHKPPPVRDFPPIKHESELSAEPPPVRDFAPIKHESELAADYYVIDTQEKIIFQRRFDSLHSTAAYIALNRKALLCLTTTDVWQWLEQRDHWRMESWDTFEALHNNADAKSEAADAPDEVAADAEEQPPTNGQRHPALFTSSSDEWYTPPHLCDAVLRAFGELPDLDPCTAEGAVMDAKRKFTIAQDGLSQIWRAGTLFLNPPFSTIDAWVERLANAYRAGVGEAIALLPARTDTAWMQRLAPFPRCFLHGRVKYLSPTGESASAPFPSVVVYMGDNLTAFADAFASLGDIYVRWQHANGL